MVDFQQNKRKVLKHFLDICVLDGWNDASLKEAIDKSKVKEDDIFGNINDLINFFIEEGNAELVKKANKIEFKQLRVRDKIKELVKLRLLIEENNKNPLKALVTISKGKRIPNLLKNNYKIADLMWELAGDNSTDFNFYSKRLILSKVFSKTFLYFINDESSNNADSWDFLDKEIEKVMIIGKVKMQIKNCADKIHNCGSNISNLKENLKDLPFIRLFKK